MWMATVWGKLKHWLEYGRNVAQYMQHGAKEQQEKKGTGYLVEKLCLKQTLLSKQTKTNHHHERCGTRSFSPYPRTRKPERRPSIKSTPIRWPCHHEVFYCLIYEHVENLIAKTKTKTISTSGTVVLAAGYWLAVRAVPRQYVHKIMSSMLQQLRSKILD